MLKRSTCRVVKSGGADMVEAAVISDGGSGAGGAAGRLAGMVGGPKRNCEIEAGATAGASDRFSNILIRSAALFVGLG